jgi:hypothetical protein
MTAGMSKRGSIGRMLVTNLILSCLSLGCGDDDGPGTSTSMSTSGGDSGGKHGAGVIDAAVRDDAGAPVDASEVGDSDDIRECRHTSDCPEPANPGECAMRRCIANRCSVDYAVRGTEVVAQTAHDCRKAVCDGEGNPIQVDDDADVADDGNPCTKDSCKDGSVLHTVEPAGTACEQHGGTMCDGAGECVECVQASDCNSQVCQGGACRPALCGNGQLDPGEADVDCGGSCGPCGPGAACTQPEDCAGNVCTAHECAPSCTDKVKNGTESDVDCGRDCPNRCDNGLRCRGNVDCASAFCALTERRCVEPACDDGMMNGDETEVDCGGSCPACPVFCEWSHECGATDVCYPNVCVHSVNGCSIGTATDMRNMDQVSISFDGNGYTPSCLLVTMFTQVTFEGSFADYPLLGGQIKDGLKQPATSGPFVAVTDSGTSHLFSLNECAIFPFYCAADGSNMAGTIFVVAPQ